MLSVYVAVEGAESFKALECNYYVVHPQLLKEYNNRWFLICWHKHKMINLALDRIIRIETDEKTDYQDKNVNGDDYFSEVIGVTISERQRCQNVFFKVVKAHAPYAITKPFHHSQVVVDEDQSGTTFRICVQLNFELERMILGLGEFITVLGPRRLKKRIENSLRLAFGNYNLNQNSD